MIVLLSCSISSLARNNDDNPLTGELVQSNDSILISYDDLRLANAKMIELDFLKQTNSKLNEIILNDTAIINSYKTLNTNLTNDCKKYIKQRNIAIGTGAAVAVVLISTLFLIK